MIKINSRNEMHLLLNDIGVKIGIEIGVHRADYSKYLLENVEFETFFMVDVWRTNRLSGSRCGKGPEYISDAVSNVDEYGDKAIMIRCSSMRALSLFQDDYFDFVYLDASHKKKYFYDDMFLWYDKLKKGGLYAGHDYHTKKYLKAVKNIVDEFTQKHNKNVCITHLENHPTWYFVK